MSNSTPPFGILYLAAHLRNKGHSVLIIDIAKTRQGNAVTLGELRSFRPEVIAVSGIITAYGFIRELMRDLKSAFPDVHFIIGGHVTLDTVELLITRIGFHYTVLGYGEIKVEYLLDHIQGERPIESIPGIGYLKDGSVRINPGECFFKDINSIPLPAYDLIDMEYYITIEKDNPALRSYLEKTGKKAPPLRTMMVIGALGCTDRCSFCIHEFAYRGFRVHSTEYIMENIRHLHDNYGVRVFLIGEDLFLFREEQAVQFCEAMSRHCPDAYFELITRANFLTPRMMEVLSDSNCYALGFGFESGSNRILSILMKRMDRLTNISAHQKILATPITPKVSFMVGTPGETGDTILDTVSAIQEAGVGAGGIFYTTPYPGSRLFRWCMEHGYIKDKEEYLLKISNRDASMLSINLTPYPDLIVKMMYVMIEDAILSNAPRSAATVPEVLKRHLIKGSLVPLAFRSYFILRRLMSYVLKRYRAEAIDPSLSDRPYLKLSTDKIEFGSGLAERKQPRV